MRHGSIEIDQRELQRFGPRRQQIGQCELLAEVVVYASCGERMRGARVLHWVDNASAVAASVKGYSRAIDSARIIHELHARALELQVSVWFEYVRTKANVSDEPSRTDLSGAVFDFRCVAPEVAAFVGSTPLQACFPADTQWAAEDLPWRGCTLLT